MKCRLPDCNGLVSIDGFDEVCHCGHRIPRPETVKYYYPNNASEAGRVQDAGDINDTEEVSCRNDSNRKHNKKCESCGKPSTSTLCWDCHVKKRNTGGLDWHYTEGKKCACGKPILTKKAEKCRSCAGRKNGFKGKAEFQQLANTGAVAE